MVRLGVNHLGHIRDSLEGLIGLPTVAHELIQNGDDAKTHPATWLRFDVRDEALFVENDGSFSDCGDPEADECRNRQHGQPLCDFHRFCDRSSGDKRRDSDTTGAFGIGFLAVYQITDKPELVSGVGLRLHWHIDEMERHEDDRIKKCTLANCRTCQEANVPRTRFRLPWVREPTPFRQEIGAQAVPDDIVDQFTEAAKIAAADSLPFLRRLRRIEVRRNGVLVYWVERVDNSGTSRITLNDPDGARTYMLLETSFATEGLAIRSGARASIGEKKGTGVRVALPQGNQQRGLYYATLPTEHAAPIPALINADFFPFSDRKRLILDDGPRGAWNRAAIRAAARAIAASLVEIAETIGDLALWQLIDEAHDTAVHQARKKGDPSDAYFWEELAKTIAATRIVLTVAHGRLLPGQVRIAELGDARWGDLLERLDVRIVTPELAGLSGILEQAGVDALSFTDVADRLERAGLRTGRPIESLPFGLNDDATRMRLMDLLQALAKRAGDEEPAARKDLRELRAYPNT